jgi:hypothetical protein
MAASAAALFWFGRGQTIRGDNLEYAVRLSTEPLGHTLLHTPPNKYLIAVPLLVYKAMFEIFGLTSYVPYRIVAIGLTLLCAALFYALIRRRIGDLLAIPPTLILLFFGSGFEEVMTAIRLPSLIAIACGLGALLLLERRDLAADVLAAALLCVAVASHPTGVAFTAAAAVLILLRPSPERWTRVWVFLAPAAVFGAWWLFWRAPTTPTFPTHASDVFLFVRESWVNVTAVVTGLSGVLDRPVYRQPVAEVAGSVLFALVVVGVVLRFRRLPPSFWASLAALLVLLVSTRLSPGGFLRHPDEARYMFPETILFLLVLVELAAAVTLPRWATWACAAVLLLGFVSNAVKLRDEGFFVRTQSAMVKGQLSAYEIAGSNVDPGYAPTAFDTTAGDDLHAMETYGSPALSPAELAAASMLTRLSADEALIGSMGIALRPAPGQRGAAPGPAPRVEQSFAGPITHRPGCVDMSPPANANPDIPPPLAVLDLPPGGAVVSSSELPGVHLTLSQFAVPPVTPLPPAEHGGTAVLRIPKDEAPLPWKLMVRSSNPVAVCGIPAKLAAGTAG